MRPTRVIARLDIKNEYVIKSIKLEGLRKVGDPKDLAKKYYNMGIDEIIFIDTVATLYGRNNLFNIIKEVTKNVFIPVSVGGGVRNLDDAEKLFNSGADKIAINSEGVKNPKFITLLANKYGSQSIISSIEAKKINNEWIVFTTNGRDMTKLRVIEWAKKCENLGAGELLITSIDREGTGKGVDKDLFSKISEEVKIPVIISGGVGNYNHIIDLRSKIQLDAIALARTLHFNLLDIKKVKEILSKKQYVGSNYN